MVSVTDAACQDCGDDAPENEEFCDVCRRRRETEQPDDPDPNEWHYYDD